MNLSSTTSELDAMFSADSSRKRSWALPVFEVSIRSSKKTLVPMKRLRLAIVGGVPLASVLIAAVVPTSVGSAQAAGARITDTARRAAKKRNERMS